LTAKAKRTKSNQSVEKVLQIIEVMAQNKGPMRLQDIANQIGQPASSVIRFLNTLMKYGYVDQDPDTSKYSLSMKFCKIGDMVSSQFSVRDLVRPYLFELSEKCGESVCLAVEQNMEAVYLDVADGPNTIIKVMQRIGHRAPLHCTGVGKLLLLNYSITEIDRLIQEKGLVKLTENTIVEKSELLAELNKIRQSGYAVDNEECEIGARCIAAPLLDYSGKVIASFSITGPVSRMTDEKMSIIKPLIINTTRNLTKKLGWEGSSEKLWHNSSMSGL
jgi:DNA-binding IclR family transcriptional regulator